MPGGRTAFWAQWLLAGAHHREDDVVTNTGRGSDLLDAVPGLEKSADLLPPFTLRPLATLSDAPQCCEFVVRHCRKGDGRHGGGAAASGVCA
jgi:hypothetical protein